MDHSKWSLTIAAVLLIAFGLQVAHAEPVPYTCYQAEVTVGRASQGTQRTGTIYYLAGWDLNRFVDEIAVEWHDEIFNRDARADLKCSGDVIKRHCYLGEDSGFVHVMFGTDGWPRMNIYEGELMLGRDDVGGYHVYVSYPASNSVQTLAFLPMDHTACDTIFPEAQYGRGREVVVQPPPAYDLNGLPPAQMTPLPIRPKP